MAVVLKRATGKKTTMANNLKGKAMVEVKVKTMASPKASPNSVARATRAVAPMMGGPAMAKRAKVTSTTTVTKKEAGMGTKVEEGADKNMVVIMKVKNIRDDIIMRKKMYKELMGAKVAIPIHKEGTKAMAKKKVVDTTDMNMEVTMKDKVKIKAVEKNTKDVTAMSKKKEVAMA